MEVLTASFLVILVGFYLLLFSRKNKKKRSRYCSWDDSLFFEKGYSSNAEEQLYLVSKNEFHKRRLMSKWEYDLFKKVEKYLSKYHPYCKIYPQVSLGELMGSNSREGYSCISSKRIDFAIINNQGYAVVAIECQGAGRYQENSVHRDAVKRAACKKAGIHYLEFPETYNNDYILNISKCLGEKMPAI